MNHRARPPQSLGGCWFLTVKFVFEIDVYFSDWWISKCWSSPWVKNSGNIARAMLMSWTFNLLMGFFAHKIFFPDELVEVSSLEEMSLPPTTNNRSAPNPFINFLFSCSASKLALVKLSFTFLSDEDRNLVFLWHPSHSLVEWLHWLDGMHILWRRIFFWSIDIEYLLSGDDPGRRNWSWCNLVKKLYAL